MTASGQFDIDGTGTGGATVYVIDTDASPPTVVGTATTNSDGTWSVDVGLETTIESKLEYQDPDTGEVYQVHNKPYVSHTPSIFTDATNRWDFTSSDAGTTTVVDQNGTNDLSITGASWISAGYDGHGLSFDGVDDYANTSAGITSNAEETWAVLARGIDPSATDGIVAAHGSAWAFGDLNYAFSARSGDISNAGEMQLREYRWADSATEYQSGAATSTDWHLYSVSFDETGTNDLTEFYVDGSLVASGSGQAYGGDRTELLYLGSDPDPGQFADVDISFAIRYNRYLTSSEHADLNSTVKTGIS